MPSHSHTVDTHGNHDHTFSGTLGTGGSHYHSLNVNSWGESGHTHGIPTSYMGGAVAHSHGGAPGSFSEATNPNNGAGWQGGTHGSTGHYHTVTGDVSTTGSHGHSLSLDIAPASAGGHTVGSTGGSSSVDVRQPYVTINWMIWT
jgi:hypothetical protein